MLIAARALLGIAGATLMPSTLALIRNMFHDATQRSKAIAIWTGVLTGGIALGPVLSGFLLEHFWWGSVFLINIPAMVLLLVLGPLLLPEFTEAHPGRFDLISAALSLARDPAGDLRHQRVGGTGLFDRDIWATSLAGVAVGVVFVIRQRRIADPMLDLSLFAGRQFSGSLVGQHGGHVRAGRQRGLPDPVPAIRARLHPAGRGAVEPGCRRCWSAVRPCWPARWAGRSTGPTSWAAGSWWRPADSW